MIDLTARLVAAYLRKNTVDASELAALIGSVHSALASAAQPAPGSAAPQTPFTSVRKSVTPEAIICLECGRPQQMAKRHLRTAHGMSIDEYKAKWSLPADYPMVAPNYAAKRSQLAIASGLGRKEPVAEVIDPSATVPPTQHSNRYPASRWAKPKS